MLIHKLFNLTAYAFLQIEKQTLVLCQQRKRSAKDLGILLSATDLLEPEYTDTLINVVLFYQGEKWEVGVQMCSVSYCFSTALCHPAQHLQPYSHHVFLFGSLPKKRNDWCLQTVSLSQQAILYYCFQWMHNLKWKKKKKKGASPLNFKLFSGFLLKHKWFSNNKPRVWWLHQ